MKNKEFVEALSLFNQKVEKLESLSFISKAVEGTNASISWRESFDGYGDLSTERIGPTTESIDAFILTFRFFIQKNEICSLQNLSKLYDIFLKNNELRIDFEKARSAINKFLDSGPQLDINFNGESLTYRKIMDIIIFGDLSHANKEKKEKFKQWMNSPLSSFIENALVSTLVIFYQYLNRIKQINDKVLTEI